MLDTFLKGFKPYLTPSNYDKFVAQLTAELTLQLEKAVFKMAFNRVTPPFHLSISLILYVLYTLL